MSGPNKEGFTWPLWKNEKNPETSLPDLGQEYQGPIWLNGVMLLDFCDNHGHLLMVEVVDAGQAWCTQTYSDWAESAWQRPLSLRSLIPSSSRTSTVFQERMRTLHSNGPCSAPPLLSCLHGTVAARWLVQVVVNIRGETSIQAEEGVLLALVGIR